MKKIFKFFIVAALLLFTGNVANAQLKLGANFGVQVPVGDYGDGFKTGFGGNIGGEYLITERIGANLNFGFYSLGIKGTGLLGVGDESATVIPITLGGSYYFMTDKLKPYAGLDLGVWMLGSTMEGAETNAYFGFAPVAGVQYEFNDNWALNGNLKFNYVLSGEEEELVGMVLETPDFTTFGINVGIVYTFGK